MPRKSMKMSGWGDRMEWCRWMGMTNVWWMCCQRRDQRWLRVPWYHEPENVNDGPWEQLSWMYWLMWMWMLQWMRLRLLLLLLWLRWQHH